MPAQGSLAQVSGLRTAGTWGLQAAGTRDIQAAGTQDLQAAAPQHGPPLCPAPGRPWHPRWTAHRAARPSTARPARPRSCRLLHLHRSGPELRGAWMVAAPWPPRPPCLLQPHPYRPPCHHPCCACRQMGSWRQWGVWSVGVAREWGGRAGMRRLGGRGMRECESNEPSVSGWLGQLEVCVCAEGLAAAQQRAACLDPRVVAVWSWLTKASIHINHCIRRVTCPTSLKRRAHGHTWSSVHVHRCSWKYMLDRHKHVFLARQGTPADLNMVSTHA